MKEPDFSNGLGCPADPILPEHEEAFGFVHEDTPEKVPTWQSPEVPASDVIDLIKQVQERIADFARRDYQREVLICYLWFTSPELHQRMIDEGFVDEHGTVIPMPIVMPETYGPWSL